jgi:hypothetical protein
MIETVAMQQLLQSPETTATVVHAIIRKLYGEEAYGWDMVTIMLELKDDLKIDLESNLANRWAAMQVVMTTDAFFTRLDAFLAICNALSTGDPFFTVFDPVTVEEAAWGISEVALNRELLPFSPAIKEYLRVMLTADGYVADAPDIFDVVFDDENVHADVRTLLRQIYRSPNTDTVEAYLEDQLRDIASQFDQIPSLSGIDNLLLSGPIKTGRATKIQEGLEHEGYLANS